MTRTLLTILVLLLTAAVRPLSTSAENDYAVERLTTIERKKDQVLPALAWPWVVWKDYRNLSLRAVDDSPNGEIIALNIETGEEVDAAESSDSGDPAISGTVVVWTSGRGRTTEIQGIDLLDRRTFSLTQAGGRQERPAISGNLIVWQDNRNGNWDIFARDLTEEDDRPIVEQRQDQLRPAVSGSVVVWEDWRDRAAGPDVYGTDLETSTSFRLTTTHDAFEPKISARWVVWVGAVDQAVFARNLDQGTTRRITRAPGPKTGPAISGRLVTWTDERNGDRDLYGYDLETDTEFVIARADGPQDSAAVENDILAWSDGRGANRNIVLARVTLPGLLDAPSPEAGP